MALVRATGLWVKDGKRGQFWSGRIREAIPAGSAIMLFENDKAEDEEDPEFTLSYANDEEDEQPRRSASKRSARSSAARKSLRRSSWDDD